MLLRERIRAFIKDNMAIKDLEVEIEDSDNIFKMGFVDSLFAMKLVCFVESELQLEITDNDLDLSNFNSVHNIVNFLEAKKSR